MKAKFVTIFIILSFFTLGILYTRPLISYFDRGIPYGHAPSKGWEVMPLYRGDHLQLYYHLWLAKDALRAEHPFFCDPYEFNVGNKAIFSARRLPLSILFVLLSIFGNTFAYNSLIILSFLFSGITMYLLVRLYTRDRLAAFVSGLIFCLAPFRLSQLLGGHTNGFLFCLLPLTIYFYEKTFIRAKPIYAMLAGLCLLSFALIEYHFLYYMVLFTAFYIPLKITSGLKNWPEDKTDVWNRLLKSVAPICLVLILSIGFAFYMKKVEIGGSIAGRGRELAEVAIYSPRPSDLFRRINSNAEKFIYLGIFPLALALIGSVTSVFKRTSPADYRLEKMNTLFYGLIFIVTCILSLGLSLDNIFPLYRICYRYLPYFNFPRAPSRMIALSFMAMAVLAGYAIVKIRRLMENRSKTAFTIIYLSILLAILIDYYPPGPIGISLSDEHNKIYEVVKDRLKKEDRILEIPLWPGDSSWSSVYLYYITTTRAKIVNGYYPLVPKQYVNNIFRPLVGLNVGDIGDKEYQLLKDLRVKYIIVHQEAFPGKVSHFPSFYTVERLRASRFLRFLNRDGPIWLFELLDEPRKYNVAATVKSSVTGVILEAERLPRRVGRVVSDQAAANDSAAFGDVSEDSKDYLIYGLQQRFPKGRYIAHFRLKTDDNLTEEPVAIVDICAEKGKIILAESQVRGTDFVRNNVYQDINLSFSVDRPMGLEFRVYFSKITNLWVDYVYILFEDQRDPSEYLEVEGLFYRGNLIDDENASGGYAILAEANKVPGSEFIYGPYRRYESGRYIAYFLLKIDKPKEGKIATLQIAANYGQDILANRVVQGRDFEFLNKYQRFEVPFSLKKEVILEFRIIFHRASDLWADSVGIKRLANTHPEDKGIL